MLLPQPQTLPCTQFHFFRPPKIVKINLGSGGPLPQMWAMPKRKDVLFWEILSYLEVFNFTSGVVLLAANLGHRLESQVLLVVVDEPWRALWDVVKAEGEGDEEDEGA